MKMKTAPLGRLLAFLAGLLLLASAAGVVSLSLRIHREIRSSSEDSLREMLSVITQHTDQMFLRDDQALSRWAHVFAKMDADSGRFVVHPNNLAGTKGGNRNLRFFLEHNQVTDTSMLEQIEEGIAHGDRMMIRLTLVGRPSYMYFWPTAEGRHYLVGYVPEDSITSLSDSVTMTIVFMLALLAALFLILAAAYVIYYRYRRKIESERALEQEEHMRQVSQALELAQAANRSKSIFLSNMSHDIRTPMNAILGFSTLLMRDAEDPRKVREYTRKVSSSSQHLLSLINDVLDMSKIESGKMVLNVSRFDLADVVAAVDTVIRPQAAAKNQTLEVSVNGLRHETLLGDETRINQILINLLSNAVKYTQEGGHIDFILQGFQTSPQFQGLQITVRDNGYGMTPEYCEHIFEAFSRAENSTTNKVQGTGLGMAITKSTVELMGGTIHVDSTYGEGSTFTVRLELSVPEEDADASFWETHGIRRMLVLDGDEEAGQAGVNAFLQRPFFVANLKAQLAELRRSSVPAEAAVPDLLEGCRFLAAEDNELNAEILCELLEMQGASCDVVENGRLAVGAFQAGRGLHPHCRDDGQRLLGGRGRRDGGRDERPCGQGGGGHEPRRAHVRHVGTKQRRRHRLQHLPGGGLPGQNL